MFTRITVQEIYWILSILSRRIRIYWLQVPRSKWNCLEYNRLSEWVEFIFLYLGYFILIDLIIMRTKAHFVFFDNCILRKSYITQRWKLAYFEYFKRIITFNVCIFFKNLIGSFLLKISQGSKEKSSWKEKLSSNVPRVVVTRQAWIIDMCKILNTTNKKLLATRVHA